MVEPLLLKNPDGPHSTGKNLCFSNAVVQLLRHNLHFQQHVIFKRSSDNNVFNELYRILRHQGTTSLASCANLRRIIGMTVGNNDLWSGNQQDAVEFLTFLLNNLDEECKQIFFFHHVSIVEDYLAYRYNLNVFLKFHFPVVHLPLVFLN